MFATTLRKIHRLSRRLWVRVALISGMAFVALGAAKLFGPMIPDGLSEAIGADALNRLLDIISTSMLAVTTFSLSVMVSVHQSASSRWTPRAHRMLLADTTTQTVLATFIGAYIYSLAAIILLSTPYYGEKEIVTLYLATLAVLVLIVVVILRWILHLQALGSLVDTTVRIEREAVRAFEARMERPCLGGHALKPGDIPGTARPIRAKRTAYIQAIYEDSLQVAAEEHDGRVYLDAPIGRFVHRGEVIAHIEGGGEALEEAVRGAVHMGELRTVEQDPRFALIMLSEVGSKALSPGINDPGTAIDVIGRIGRVIGGFRDEMAHGRDTPIHDRLWVVPLDPLDLMQDGFGAMARDGATQVEVLISMLKTLTALQDHPDTGIAAAAREMAHEALERGRAALEFDRDRDRLARAAPEIAARGRIRE
ncbi:DUF2254 domain-containing protein [Limimaricola variabilis]